MYFRTLVKAWMSKNKTLKNQPIIIAGMHRSGTSLTASILQKAGVNIGHELLGPGVGNTQGHFEDVEIGTFHQDVLMSQGIGSDGWTTLPKVHVSQQFVGRAKALRDKRVQEGGLWGWKEPRTTLFLDFWNELIPEAKFVFVYRSPWEVVDSLFTRGDTTFANNPRLAVEVWQTYNNAILDFYNLNQDCSILLHIDNLQGTENSLISRISQKLKIALNPLNEKVFQSSEMHREVSTTHRPVLLSRYFPNTLDLYKKLDDIADLSACGDFFEDTNPSSEESYRDWILQDWRMNKRYLVSLQQTQTELQQTQTELQQTQTELQQTQTELQQTQTELQQTQTELQQTQTELQQTQTELQQTQTELQQTQTELQQIYKGWHSAQSQLQQAHEKWQTTQNIIKAMQSSKFWKIRRIWFQFKRIFGLKTT